MIIKCYLKLLKANRTAFALSIGLLVFILLLNFSSQGKMEEAYTGEKIHLVVDDQDKSKDSKEFLTYLKKKHQVQALDPKKGPIKNQIYLENFDAHLVIKEKFLQHLQKNEPAVSISFSESNMVKSYIRLIIDRYLVLKKTSLEEGKVFDPNILDQEVPTQLVDLSGNQKVNISHLSRASGYVLLLGILLALIGIESDFTRKSVQERIALSTLSKRKFFIQHYISQGIAALILMGVILAMDLFMCQLKGVPINWELFIVSSLLFGLAAIAMTNALLPLSPNKKTLMALANAISLLIAFISGSMIPLELLPHQILFLAKLFPLYYYHQVLNDQAGLSFQSYATIQILFTLVYLLIAYYLHQKRLNRQLN
ncbi:ABC transporter permease [Atopobacter sp. AH10]|uniref:ABC transporter permease n=1 Tax=Atopobacter sp. AH10 TaxID=2315861 RepID=UPI000EF278A7|nr:ABC transporter permease [Atopobacter sp. AH10]RLK62609.1 ABC transporter permease [Atopobacter sp. AH10]